MTKPIPSNQNLCDDCVVNLERNFRQFLDSSPDGWFGLLDGTLKPIFLKRFTHDEKFKAVALVRKICNLKHHYNEQNYAVIKAYIGEMPDSFMKYWLKIFPSLINKMRDAYDDFKVLTSFKKYF